MMERLREWIASANRWIYVHWRLVMLTLVGIIMMQQCTISRLRWEIEHLGPAVVALGERSEPVDSVKENGGEQEVVESDSSEISMLEGISVPSEDKEESGGGTTVFVVLLLVAAVVVVVYMKRNALPPFGMRVKGRLHQEFGGDIYYDLTVVNSSPKVIEVSDATVNFGMRTGTRRFRASVATLPITLQPGTSFSATIKLTGLIMRNVELHQARIISLSATCNGKRRTTIPRPIRIGQA